MKTATVYSVQILRSGQPRPYADTEREYLITCQSQGKPWLMFGDVEAQIKRDEAMRAAGKMFGGCQPDQLRAEQLKWAKKIVRALCQNFRERDDDDGRTGMEAAFYPTLKWLNLDPMAGTIHAFIIELYTD